MKQIKSYILSIILATTVLFPAYSQDTLHLTLSETVRIAQEQSPQAIAARHSFRASYWNWRSFRANMLPSLTFTSDPSLNRSISSVTLPDGGESFVHRNQLMIDAGLTINQNIPFTGGSLFVKTALQRLDLFSEKTSSYNSTPIVIGYEQNLFATNQLKWDRKMEPLTYSKSRKNLIETLELVAAQATYQFFQLATAQTNWEIAQYNYANADTLFQYAKGRYNIGTITENEMLQLELNLLTEQTNMMNARIEVDDRVQSLRSYLGINNASELVAVVGETIPHFNVEIKQALELAYKNNPEPEDLLLQKINSDYNVAKAKEERGFKANLYMQFGLTQTNEKLKEAYRNPMDQQLVSIGIRIPILDWGVGKGKVKVALSNRDRIYTNVEQSRNDFELNVIKMVKQFNLQADKVTIAQKTDLTAQRRNDVAQKLYLLGKSTILDLNASISEKDRARREYITALYNYWSLYYGLRSMTGYDFEKSRELTFDYEQLMK